jgi:hypothetical protein
MRLNTTGTDGTAPGGLAAVVHCSGSGLHVLGMRGLQGAQGPMFCEMHRGSHAWGDWGQVGGYPFLIWGRVGQIALSSSLSRCKHATIATPLALRVKSLLNCKRLTSGISWCEAILLSILDASHVAAISGFSPTR